MRGGGPKHVVKVMMVALLMMMRLDRNCMKNIGQ